MSAVIIALAFLAVGAGLGAAALTAWALSRAAAAARRFDPDD